MPKHGVLSRFVAAKVGARWYGSGRYTSVAVIDLLMWTAELDT